ncbi:MAG: hypothetical protein Kow0037_11610 [Calditrichia bacterium]
MIYDTEKKLVKDFKNTFIKSLKGNNNIFILEEVDTSWGKADLLVIKYNYNIFQKRQQELREEKIIPFTNIAAYAINFIIDNPFCTQKELKKFLKVKNGIYLETIQNLLNRGLIYSYKNNSLRARSFKKTYFIREIQTYEVKLNKWKKVIEQAERHLWFTNSSYIVLPSISYTLVEKIKKACTEKGIGFILQDSKKTFKIIKQPPNKKHLDSVFSWKLNESLIDGTLING